MLLDGTTPAFPHHFHLLIFPQPFYPTFSFRSVSKGCLDLPESGFRIEFQAFSCNALTFFRTFASLIFDIACNGWAVHPPNLPIFVFTTLERGISWGPRVTSPEEALLATPSATPSPSPRRAEAGIEYSRWSTASALFHWRFLWNFGSHLEKCCPKPNWTGHLFGLSSYFQPFFLAFSFPKNNTHNTLQQ